MSPSIFAQIFTIIGLRKRAGMHDEFVAIPLVYALLSGKKTRAYAQVLKAVKTAVQQYNSDSCAPTKILSDFGLAIINACKEVFPDLLVSGCFFHLELTFPDDQVEEGNQL